MNIHCGPQKDVARHIQARRSAQMRQEVTGGRTPGYLIAGLLVGEIEVDARKADACAEFRYGAFRAEAGWLKDGIEGVERGAVLKTGIVVGGPPGGCPSDTYVSIDKDTEAEILKYAAHGRCVIQLPVAKCIDALARGTGSGCAKPKERIHLLRPKRSRGKRKEY